TLTRRYQLLALDSGRTVEMEAERKKLLESEFGVPAVPSTLQSLLRLWRAEDAMRIGAPRIALAELDQLDTDEPDMDGLQSLRTIALFRARMDDRCLIEIESQQAALETPDPMLQSMRWWIMLRQGKAKAVLAELEGLESPTNATLRIEAAAQFPVHREPPTA